MTEDEMGLTKQTGVYLLEAGRYKLHITAKHPLSGKIVHKRVTVSARSAKEAASIREAETTKFRNELANKSPRSDPGQTLEEYAQAWQRRKLAAGKHREHVVDRNLLDLRTFVFPILGKVKVGAITRSHLAFWADEVEKLRAKNGQDYSRATRAKAWRIFRSVLNDAFRNGAIKDNPTEHWIYEPTGAAKKKKTVLEGVELEKFFSHTHVLTAQNRAMLILAATTGMRFGEMSALEWTDIDFIKQCIYITKSQVKGKVGLPKSGLTRTVPLHPDVAELLKELQAEQLSKNNDSKLVFPGRFNQYKQSNSLKHSIAEVLKAAGIDKHIEVHSLRRSFNDLLRRIAGKEVTKSITGHVTDEMYEHYSTVTVEEKAAATTRALAPVLKLVPTGAKSGEQSEKERSAK